MAITRRNSNQSSKGNSTPNPKPKKSGKRQKSGNECVDRISDLPESVLLHILSFLPTKFAVRTMVLSKRWEPLWTSVPCLDFDEWVDKGMTFMRFVNRVMFEHNCGSIRKFRIQFSSTHSYAFDVEPWVKKAILRNLEELDLCVQLSTPTIQLPVSTFTCKTLSVLKLRGAKLRISVPRTACLPNMKRLELYSVQFQDKGTLAKLISCCSVLENLIIVLDSSVGNLPIHSPTLKSLTLHQKKRSPTHSSSYSGISSSSSDDSDSDSDSDRDIHVKIDRKDEEAAIDINAPVLRYLDIEDCFSSFLWITNIGSLNRAKLDLRTSIPCQSLIECFDAFNNVKFLTLDGVPATETTVNLEAGLPLLTFTNLTHLTMGAGCVWRPMLPYFLQYCEKLEVLDLTSANTGGRHTNAENHSWNDPATVPICLTSCLRFISIADFRDSKTELGMLKYIMKHGMVLRKVLIQPVGESDGPLKVKKANPFEEKFLRSEINNRELRTKLKIAKKIMNFNRRSKRCRVGFF